MQTWMNDNKKNHFFVKNPLSFHGNKKKDLFNLE